MVRNGTILVVDDEPDVRDMLSEYLSGHGYSVLQAAGGVDMRKKLAQSLPDLVLLDIRMPGEDGLSLARYLRERYSLAIIMLTASGEVIDRVIGLEIGADDYIAKPFDPRELLARIKSVLRRYNSMLEENKTTNQIAIGRYLLDLNARRLLDDKGRTIPLTSMEFDLLNIFAERPNRVLNRDQLLNLSQNRDWDPYDRSVDIRIARLRRKIEPDPAKPQILKTVRGAGYMFVPVRNKSS